MRCPSCDHDNRVDRRFCAECGVALAPRCVTCGAANETAAKFCGGCGAALTASSAPSATSPRAAATAAPAAAEVGERRRLTVLFCDLVGSTEIAARLDPEQW